MAIVDSCQRASPTRTDLLYVGRVKCLDIRHAAVDGFLRLNRILALRPLRRSLSRHANVARACARAGRVRSSQSEQPGAHIRIRLPEASTHRGFNAQMPLPHNASAVSCCFERLLQILDIVVVL